MSLSAHLTAGTADHGRLAFHPDCPRCRAERLAGSLGTDSLVSRRAQAALAAGLLAFSAGAVPAVAQVPEVDPGQQETSAPGGEPPGLSPDFDPGGDDTFDYNTAPDAFIAGRLATYSSDLTIAAVLMGKPEPPTFEWAVLPYPPGSETRVNFNDIGLYAMSSKTPNKDLAWEVLKFWTNGEQAAYWTGVSGTYPARVDAAEMGYDEHAVAQLADSFDLFQKYSVGPEPFAAFGAVEADAAAQAARAYSGEITAEEAVANIEQIVQQEVFG